MASGCKYPANAPIKTGRNWQDLQETVNGRKSDRTALSDIERDSKDPSGPNLHAGGQGFESPRLHQLEAPSDKGFSKWLSRARTPKAGRASALPASSHSRTRRPFGKSELDAELTRSRESLTSSCAPYHLRSAVLYELQYAYASLVFTF